VFQNVSGNSQGQTLGSNWLLADQQGTVRDIVYGSFVRKHIDYDATGTPNETNYLWDGTFIPPTSPDAIDELFGYAGAEQDEATGLAQMGARWYDPNLARFLSEDPSGFDGGDQRRFVATALGHASSLSRGGLGCYRYVGSRRLIVTASGDCSTSPSQTRRRSSRSPARQEACSPIWRRYFATGPPAARPCVPP
jgi:RHS repeat-associated protein